MFQNARDHFVQNVRPAYQEFFERRRRNELGLNELVRHGVVAATALSHLREHLSSSPTNASLDADCPDFALVRDVANASKHLVLTNHRPRLTGADQISEVGVGTTYRDEQGEYINVQAEVIVRLDDGTERYLADILCAVMSMWCVRLAALGIIDTKNPEVPRTDAHVPREKASNKNMALRMMQGEDWRSSFQMRRFNYESGVSELMDLTGAKATFTIRKPPESIHILYELRTEARIYATDFDVPLTPQQGVECMRMHSDDERVAYAMQLVNSTSALQDALTAKLCRDNPGLSAERRSVDDKR